mmetsp:Transcript_34811/g.109299  ORF Transcript_34811/g.109299 Transcript_34811/m.109299 type:complete len:246 (+) Transcript_34811:54-791(+)
MMTRRTERRTTAKRKPLSGLTSAPQFMRALCCPHFLFPLHLQSRRPERGHRRGSRCRLWLLRRHAIVVEVLGHCGHRRDRGLEVGLPDGRDVGLVVLVVAAFTWCRGRRLEGRRRGPLVDVLVLRRHEHGVPVVVILLQNVWQLRELMGRVLGEDAPHFRLGVVRDATAGSFGRGSHQVSHEARRGHGDEDLVHVHVRSNGEGDHQQRSQQRAAVAEHDDAGHPVGKRKIHARRWRLQSAGLARS